MRHKDFIRERLNIVEPPIEVAPQPRKGFFCVMERGPCRSPIACDGFGYCRERNQDGAPMDDQNIARRRAESDAVYTEFFKRG